MQSHNTTPPTDSTAAVFAHEFRESLTSILLAVQAAGEVAADGLTNRELWDLVECQARHLVRLVDRVIAGSRGSCRKLVPLPPTKPGIFDRWSNARKTHKLARMDMPWMHSVMLDA